MKTGLFLFGVFLVLAGIALVLVSAILLIVVLVRRRKSEPVAAAAATPQRPAVAPPPAVSPSATPPTPARPAAPDPTVVLPLRKEAGLGFLRCVKGPREGTLFPVPQEGLWIGRDPAVAQLIVDNGAVSKRHVWIGPRNGGVVASDEGSTNGTYLQSAPTVRIKEVALKPGDVLVISDDIARFEYRSEG